MATNKYRSLFGRYELFIAAACVGAHANESEGFRQREVRFLSELFLNWVENGIHKSSLQLQNTQIARYLDHLVAEGFARKISREKHPRYRLTRVGLLELVSRMAETPREKREGSFFFLFYFIKNYGPRIFELVRKEGGQFPSALRIELEALLDAKQLLAREIRETKREMEKLAARSDDARNSSSLCTRLHHGNSRFEEIVKELENRFPYDLNSQKPLSELIFSLPPEARRWELEVGNLCRAAEIWDPERRLLDSYLKELSKLEQAIS